MRIDKSALREFILTVVKPLKTGKTVSQNGDQASLDNLYPDGGYSGSFKSTSPFGLISKVPKGVTAFYQALQGSGFESIILAFLHKARPEPSAPGETVLYSTTASGATIKVKVTLKNDGTIEIDAPTKVQITSPNVEVTSSQVKVDSSDIELGSGTLEKIINGETFQTLYNNHMHPLDVPNGKTFAPITQMASSELSAKVKAAK